MRVILTGGGTGGHVNPALAIADIIKKNDPNAEIAYIGTKRGIENRLATREGYPIYHVESRGFSRSLSPKNLIAAWYYFTSPRTAKKIIKKLQPDIVIGTGGHVCYAPLRAAAELGIPTLVHESNAYPGKAVKMLEDRVDRILLNFPQAAERLTAKEKLAVVGNPLRGEFGTVSKAEARAALGIDKKYKSILLSYGGSLGAPAINDAALEIMKNYDAAHPEVLHIHATGRERFDDFKKAFDGAGLGKYENIQISEYIYDMPKKLAAADLVICRAGAMTVTEMARMKKAAIMIPSPYVTDDHQYKNAKVLADVGAVALISQKELTSELIVNTVAELLGNKARRAGMEQAIAAFAANDVEKLIYKEIKDLIK